MTRGVLAPICVGHEIEEEGLLALLFALVHIDQIYLRKFPSTPLLYACRIRYARDPRWLDIPSLLHEGEGDCKSLVAFRVAELRQRGIDARPCLKPGRDGLHALVQWPDGHLEDPSTACGMSTSEDAPS